MDGVGRRRRDDAQRPGPGTAASDTPTRRARLHDAVAATGQAGIDAEHEHSYERSLVVDRRQRDGRPMWESGFSPPRGCADETLRDLDDRRSPHRRGHPGGPRRADTTHPGTAHRRARGGASTIRAVSALTDLDLSVPTGQITVLLGPNGAGKTTAIRMITGALTPNEGTIRVFGLDPDRDGDEVRRRCGVVSAKPALYDRLTGRDNLQYAAELYGVGRNADGAIRDAADRFGIDDALDQQVGGYSTGMKTRLALARAVLTSPELLLLDEPTSGLDPESSHAVLALIRE